MIHPSVGGAVGAGGGEGGPASPKPGGATRPTGVASCPAGRVTYLVPPDEISPIEPGAKASLFKDA